MNNVGQPEVAAHQFPILFGQDVDNAIEYALREIPLEHVEVSECKNGYQRFFAQSVNTYLIRMFRSLEHNPQ